MPTMGALSGVPPSEP
jgi:hypothetical protein